MDFQGLVDCIDRPCAVMSVSKKDRSVRVECSNQHFKNVTPPPHTDGILYYEHTPRNPKFEDFCYHAAILRETGHVYVEHPSGMIDQMAIPLACEDAEKGYCQFSFEITENAEPRRLATVSVDAAEFAVRASLTLMEAEDFKASVQAVLQDALSISGAHNSRIFLLDHKNRSFRIFCEATNSLDIHKHNEALTYDFIQAWGRAIGDSNALLLTTKEEFDRLEEIAPEWLSNLRSFDVKSLVLLPLRRSKQLIGYVDFVNFDPRTSADVKELAELITVYLAAEISNHQLMEQLTEMSTSDALTGLKNRLAMLRRMSELGNSGFGLINLDLNGLKRVNDEQGHDAGDRLLVLAAEALTKFFYQNDVFRTGGDEFIVLIPGITREVFQRKVVKFREAMVKNQEVRFAIGTCWSDGSLDVNSAFRMADDAMYADKKAYYKQNPQLGRR